MGRDLWYRSDLTGSCANVSPQDNRPVSSIKSFQIFYSGVYVESLTTFKILSVVDRTKNKVEFQNFSCASRESNFLNFYTTDNITQLFSFKEMEQQV